MELLEHGTKHADILTEANVQSTGEISHEFKVRIAQSAEELGRYCDGVIFLALPVNGHKRVMEELAPHIIEYVTKRQQQQLRDGEIPVAVHVIISSHASLGAVYLMQLLREERRRYMRRNGQEEDSTANADDFGVRITAWGTTAVTARKTSGDSVNVLTVREAVDICTVPSAPEDAGKEEQSASLPGSRGYLLTNGYDLCTALFGDRFNIRKGGLLAISLSNLNPQNHLGIVLGNMSRMDPPPPPPPPPGYQSSNAPDTTIEPWYQGQCITPAVGRLMEKLDEERIAIADALGIEVRNIFQHFAWSFHVPTEVPAEDDPTKMRPLTISEMNQMMHHYLDTDVLGPSAPDSRYVLEDVPYGLALTVVLGRLVGIPATLHESGIAILSAMYGRDFMVENELLLALGIIDEEDGGDIPELGAWTKMAYTGCFGER
ncbi:hypothetical protein ACHAXT_012753 [Thalassiosira profunda]